MVKTEHFWKPGKRSPPHFHCMLIVLPTKLETYYSFVYTAVIKNKQTKHPDNKQLQGCEFILSQNSRLQSITAWK